MPDAQMPPPVQPVDLEQAPMVYSYDPMSTKFALSLVTKTFNMYEMQRQQNHEQRWLGQEALYLGWKPPKVWEGTNVPRANLANYLVFNQVETALPIIYSALFEQSDHWFEVVSEPGLPVKTAREIQGYLEYVLDYSRDEANENTRSQIQLALKDILLYGTGGVFLEWESNKPSVKRVDPRDIYVDPATPSPDIDTSRATVYRQLATVDELNELRNQNGMNIPPTEILNYMAKARPITYSDNVHQYRDALRNIYYAPGTSDVLPNPADNRIEVLRYYTKTRIIWVLNRQWVAYIGYNPINSIPFCFAPCYPVPNRFYGLSIADVQEGYQRYAEALMNGRLDEISLGLHPPRVQKRGAILTPSQQRWKPGAVFTVADAKDVLMQEPAGVTSNIYPELQYFEMLAEKTTGVNSMLSGTPRGGNVNRSATGVQAQTKGGTSRLQMITKYVEDYLIVPILRKTVRLVQAHVPTTEWLPSLLEGQEAGAVQASELHRPLRFRMLAASRMMAKDELSAVIGPLLQFLLGGPFIQALQSTGRTVDFDEVFEMVQQATGTKRRFNFIRPLSEQEQQKLNEPPPEVQAEQQRAQQDAQVRLQMGQMKAQTEEKGFQTDIQKELIKKQPDPGEMERERIKLLIEQEMAKIKMQAEREKNQMDSQSKMLDMALKGREGETKIRQMLEEGAIKAGEASQSRIEKFKDGMLDRALKQEQSDAKIKEIKATEAIKAKAKKAGKQPSESKRRRKRR